MKPWMFPADFAQNPIPFFQNQLTEILFCEKRAPFAFYEAERELSSPGSI